MFEATLYSSFCVSYAPRGVVLALSMRREGKGLPHPPSLADGVLVSHMNCIGYAHAGSIRCGDPISS